MGSHLSKQDQQNQENLLEPESTEKKVEEEKVREENEQIIINMPLPPHLCLMWIKDRFDLEQTFALFIYANFHKKQSKRNFCQEWHSKQFDKGVRMIKRNVQNI